MFLQEVLNRYRLRQGGRGRPRSQGGGRKSPMIANSGAQSVGEPPDFSPATGVPPPGMSVAAAGPAEATGEGGGSGAGGPVGEGKEDGVGKFPIRNMNVMNPLDSSDNQIDDTVNRRRAARMHSLLQVSNGDC